MSVDQEAAVEGALGHEGVFELGDGAEDLQKRTSVYGAASPGGRRY
jgi:hypothetical protein